MDKACPLCRKPLPPGPEKLFVLGYGMYVKIAGAIGRSRPGVDPSTPWPALPDEQRCEMDQAVAMVREAADQGHLQAQKACGDLFTFGLGVAQDTHLGLVYYENAAQRGDALSQYNVGTFYRDGRGCEQSCKRAAKWFVKGALQEEANAMVELGRLLIQGKGVPQNTERAIELFLTREHRRASHYRCMS